MKVIGLTGGIGSGKSTVAQLLLAHGAVVIDADMVAREVVAQGSPGLASLVAEFGDEILTTTGELNRARLAEIAFASPEAKAKLDAITHPLVAARTAELFSEVPAGSVVVHDVALLTELSMAGNYDAVIVVDADDELRITRLIERGLTEGDARARIAHQASREARLAIADYVIVNNGSREDLARQVDEVWQRINDVTAG